MKISKIFTTILLVSVSQSFLYGQTVDSIPKKRTVKATEIIGIALPVVMITYGFISLDNDNEIRQIDYNVNNSIERNNLVWHTNVDNYVQYVPAVAAYTMKFCKVESTHGLLDMTILYGLSNLLSSGITHGLKTYIKRDRPNTVTRSFPSGHAQTAFVAAEFLHQEYKDQSVWISVGGYSAATFVGIARIYKKKHWVSDVVAGAGIGILSTKGVYWVYPYLKKAFGKKDKSFQTFIFPGYSDGNLNFSLSKTF
ncbi:MAG: phosphatase PAP2 family protein [Candidatus Azobacteroides sp.]|nr:phosphatase PAP2 family protein [Candidatus Azobacteroides sp.]